MMGKGDNFFIQDSKMSFVVGIGAGIAVFTTIGFIIMLFNFFGDGDGGSKSAKGNSNLAAGPTPTVNNPTPPSAPTGPVDIAITDEDYVRGNPDAPVTIVEFSDFECPFCQRFHPTLQQAMAEYGDDVRWVYKHFPLDSIHPQARPAANAAECAGEQGKFWEFGDKLFENQSLLSESYYKQLAQELGLNTSQFNDCVDNQKYAGKVNADYQQGLAAGVQGTPASFINGQLLSGAQPYTAVKAAIDSQL